ncbi:putative Catalase-like domain-containing protein [Seiridium unicorne]|uniref:Catalase-like domain-containing protein n=1 Tax=Seiridium unicorne TaxID=138068 RepID=A0ABR2UL32_9PEZI
MNGNANGTAVNGKANGLNNHHDDLGKRNYIRWDIGGIEKVPPGEDESIQAVIKQIDEIQRLQYNKARHCYGGTHARTQGVIVGKFIVPDDLPRHLKQSELFEKGGEYPVVCRYSSEPGDPGLDVRKRQPLKCVFMLTKCKDRIPQPRGFGMKLFDVHGEMFDAGKDFPTQDIEFNSTPALDLADAKTTKEIIDLRIKYGHDKETLYKHLNERPDTDLQTARDKVHNTHLESTRYYSQTAYRFGDYVIKYCLVPATDTQRKLAEETTKPEHGSDIMQRWLQDFHQNHNAEYLFQVQLCENLEDQPVENSGKVWDPEKYPWQTVARLVVPKQDSWKPERKMFWEDHMRIDPWHGLVKLQPLGGSNRLRRKLYPASSALRRKMNARKEIHVKSIEEIPV